MKKKINYRKWITLLILSFSGGVIFTLPYMRFTFYDPLKTALGLSHEQFGELMSFYGSMAFFLYIPGGLIADRISHKYLLSFSLITTGLGGIYLSTWPSFGGAKILFAVWGISSVFTFWSVLLKATSMLGDRSEQGKLFALSEGGRGIINSIVALTATAMIAAMGAEPQQFVYVIYLYSGVIIIMGIAAFIVVPHNKISKDERESGLNVLKDLLEVAKIPTTWILAVCIFSIYTMYTTSSYFTPYMTGVYGVSAATAALVATLRQHIFRPISGVIGSGLTKKTGSSIPAMIVAIFILIGLIITVMVLPTTKAFVVVISVLIPLIGVMAFVLRGLYFAPVGETGTPVRLLGAAMGFISTIAFTSDMFNFKIVGRILDANPGSVGYRMVFTYMLVLLAVGLVTLFVLKRISNKSNLISDQTEDIADIA